MIARSFALLNNNRMKTPAENLLIEVALDREHYNKIRMKYRSLADKEAQNFSDGFSKFFPDMDVLHEKGGQWGYQCLGRVVDVAIRDLVAQGVADIDDESFCDDYFSKYFTWEEDFRRIDDKYLAIVLKSEELDEYRTSRRQSRGRWVGGGFGVGGALKGAAQAAALNAAAGVAHGAWNLGAKAVTAVGNEVKKKNLYDAPDTKASLVSAIWTMVLDVHKAYVDALNAKKPNAVAGFVTESDKTQAKRLFENVRKGRVAAEEARKVLLESLRLNPYDDEVYQYWVEAFGDPNGVVEATALYFGVAVELSNFKERLLEKKAATLGWDSLDDCRKSLATLESFVKSISFEGFNNFKTRRLAETEAKDQARRTVKGVVYATHEAAEKERAKRTIGRLLGAGIILMPFVFSFFTLRKGYSKEARAVAFGYMVLLPIISILTSDPTQKAPINDAVVAAATPQQAASAVVMKAAVAPTTSEPLPLPFVGERTFNFYGGNGTQQKISINADGMVQVVFMGTTGSSVDYEGKFSNPIPLKDGNALLIKDKKVVLMENGNVSKGCSAEGQPCESDLYD